MDMDQMANRAEQLIGAIASSIMSATEAAAERVELASRVAQIQARMSAFGAVLDTIGVQKEALAERQKSARGPLKALLERQIEALTVQETSILEKAGVEPEAAQGAVKAADESPKLYARSGRKFQPVNGSTS
jgi:LPS O-antigen subunit length determinant protein (WzzB/FepE family)